MERRKPLMVAKVMMLILILVLELILKMTLTLIIVWIPYYGIVIDIGFEIHVER